MYIRLGGELHQWEFAYSSIVHEHIKPLLLGEECLGT
jgi:hypothetical protein